MARIVCLLLALVASASAFLPAARPLTRAAPVAAIESSRAEFLKQSMLAAAGLVAAAPVALASVAEPEQLLNYGGNPAAWQGKGPNASKGKATKIKTGNAGSIMKK